MERLKNILSQIDGRGYKAYKSIEGKYSFKEFTLYIDHVQQDPFAPPSRIRVQIPQKKAKFPQELYYPKIRNIALVDYLTRIVNQNIISKKVGTGNSGLILINEPGQEVLERNSVIINDDFVEARLSIGLPAFGRTILAKEALEIFSSRIPNIVNSSLFYSNLDRKQLIKHIHAIEDQDYLRNLLYKNKLVSFIANNALLPRESGVSNLPLKDGIPFVAPKELEVEFTLPNYGKIKGMGIPEGVTLIIGGGYHGKSTLLRAIERGVYSHILGDGREKVVTIHSAVKIRAEDGRRVEKVDISPFISNIPFQADTASFSTSNASGSTSQAANIIEALEMGTKLLLIDEDTSATNFMIRDRRMQELVSKDKEPITPFIDKVRLLYQNYQVSTILVMGGSGDYFDVADTVIMMDKYEPYDVTKKAIELNSSIPTGRHKEGGEKFGKIFNRIPLSESFNPKRGKKEVKISTKGVKQILYGKTIIDLSCIEQLIDESQTKAIGDAIYYLTQRYFDGKRTLYEAIKLLIKQIDKNGLDVLFPFKNQIHGDYVLPRAFEIAAAINRLRTLKIKQEKR